MRLEVKKGEQWWELDTNETSISLNYRQDDIKDITKKKNSYSKTILLPGTERNQQFFNHATEINTDLTNFNVKKGFPAKLYSEDQLVFEGDLILTKIDKTGEYKNMIHVTITTPLKSLDDDLSGIFLKDLQSLSQYCHERTIENIEDSWVNKITINGEKQQSQLGVGYVYPYIIKGENDNHYNHTYFFEMEPAVYVKTIIDSIFDELDVKYESKFFNSEYFRRLIIPHTNNAIQEDDEKILEKTTIIGVDPTGFPFGVVPMMQGTLSSAWIYTDSYFQDPYQLPLKRKSGTVTENNEDLEFTDISDQWTIGTFIAGQDNIMEIKESGYYNIKLDLTFYLSYEPFVSGESFNWNNKGDVEWRWQLQRNTGSGWQNVSTSNEVNLDPNDPYGILIAQPSTDSTQSPGVWVDNGTPLQVQVVKNDFWINEGDKFRFRIGYKPKFFGGITPSWSVGGLLTNNSIRTRLNLAPSHEGLISKWIMEPSSQIGYGGENICLNNTMPNISAFNFLIDISKMFNLVIVKKDDLYYIEPINDWFDSKPNVKDWNDKIDMELYDIQPMSEVNFNEWTFTYTEDTDWLNEKYTEEFGEIWGQKVVRLDNIYSNRKGELKIGFSPTPTTDIDLSSGKVAPHFLDSEGLNKDVKPRILFYGGLKSGQFKIRDKKENFTDKTYNEYPYCGMWDDPFNPQWDLSFGITNRMYYDTNGTIPLNNLFNTFHKRTFESIVDNNAKLLTGFFDLNPYDIKDFDFRDIIFLFGEYWRVNLIQDYDPVNPKLTKVELYKIIDYKTYNPTVIEDAGSQNACPSDIILRERFFVSKSGLPVSEECCSSLGGRWDGKSCVRWVNTDVVLDPVIPNTGVQPPILVAPRLPDWTLRRPVVNVWRKPGVINAVNVGNGNIINFDGVIAIGDNITPINPGIIQIGSTTISQDGLNKNWSVIRSGVDIVRPIFSLNPDIISIRSGEDEVRNICYSKVWTKIDPNLGQ